MVHHNFQVPHCSVVLKNKRHHKAIQEKYINGHHNGSQLLFSWRDCTNLNKVDQR